MGGSRAASLGDGYGVKGVREGAPGWGKAPPALCWVLIHSFTHSFSPGRLPSFPGVQGVQPGWEQC